MLEIKDLRVSYDHIQALRGISLEVKRGEFLVFLGRNGAGKSSFLLALMGLIPSVNGKILFEGEDLSSLSPWQRVKRGLALVPEGRKIFAPLSVRENLELGAFVRRNEIKNRLKKVLEVFPVLREKLTLPAGALSGGEQQMLSLARALMSNPRLLLLDEPSMGLAPKVVREIYRVLENLKGKLTILLVEQNVNRALSLADRVFLLESGRLIASWQREEIDYQVLEAAYLGEK